MILLHRLYAHNFKQLTDVNLRFPERGTVLIEGSNEAGKSSLFEAILFALYGRTVNDLTQADIRQYGADELRVELQFSIEGRFFTVSRRVVANQTVTLTWHNGDGVEETVRGARPVQTRLLDELRLSADALLNTCFVEQKDLGRLEEMDGASRRNAINELLNLRILTNLENTFRVTREDENTACNQKERVGIARLDAELPGLQAAEQAAYNCGRYRRLLDWENDWNQWQDEIIQAEGERGRIQNERATLAERLARCEELQGRLDSIDNHLVLRAKSWQEAVIAAENARTRAEELAQLADALPVRLAQHEAWATLAQRLAELECLEADADRQRQEIQAQEGRITRYRNVQAQWQEGRDTLDALKVTQEERQEALEAAERRLDERHAMNQRFERLVSLLKAIEAQANTQHEVEETEDRLRQAQTDAERLPELRARHARLEALLSQETQAARERDELQRVERDLSDITRRQQEAEARVQTIATLNEEKTQQEQTVVSARLAEQQAADVLLAVQRRLALSDWMEAAAHSGLSGSATEALADVEARQKLAKDRLDSQASVTQQAERKMKGAGGVLAAGGVVSVLGVMAGVAALVVGVVIALLGAALLMQSRGARAASQVAQAEAKSALDQLEGERQGVRRQQEMETAQQTQWAQREAEARRRLAALEVEPPVTREAAQAQIAALPSLSVTDAQDAHRRAESAWREATHRVTLIAQSLQNEQQRAQADDLPAMMVQAQRLKQAQDELGQSLLEKNGLPQERRELGLTEETNAVTEAIAGRLRDIADCESAENRLPALRTQFAEKTRQAADMAAQIGLEAQELAGTDCATWSVAAQGEREKIRAAKTQTPDVVLQQQVTTARQAVTDCEMERARIETLQKTRRQELDAATLEQLQEERDSVARDLQQNLNAQAAFADARDALQADGLPTDSQDLKIHLARQAEALHRDQERAAELPAAQARQSEAERLAQVRKAENETGWQTHLPDAPVPATPDDARQRLPELHQQAKQELIALNKPRLQEQDRILQARDSALDSDIRLRHGDQRRAREQQSHLREELGASPDEPLAELPQRLPELVQVNERDAAEWEYVLQERRNAVRDNRSGRKTRAETQGLDDAMLDLDEELQTLENAVMALDVKRQAGQVVSKTRQSIVSRVMPLTEENMRLILPLLTENRYQDVKWDEAQNTVAVYDSRARDFQRKRVFSGGAKDQISLALRLAFALATLPGEHNIRPGFLFLDEPLSSFDRDRTTALVDLVTRGVIQREFPQVFMISHSDAFDPNRFDYRLRMEGGHVLDSTLPNPDATPQR